MLSDHALVTISSDIDSTLHRKFLTTPAPGANYCVEQKSATYIPRAVTGP